MEPVDQERMREVVASIEERIKEEGWLVVGVPGEGEDHTLSYTVGLTAKGLPELLTYGLPVQTGQIILNDLAQRSIDNGRYANGATEAEVANMPVVLLDALTETPANMAKQVYIDIDVQQMIYPDPEGRFPWDEGYDMGMPPIPIHGVLP